MMVGGKLLPEDQARVILDYRSGRTPSGYQVMPDIADPFISPVDGTTISSRTGSKGAQHQEPCG